MPTKTYSRGRHTKLGRFSNTAVKQTAVQIAPSDSRAPYAYIWADRGNSDFILIGDEGGQVADLNAGDVVPLFDVAPSDIWVVANSGTQKVHFIGHGDPEA